MCIYESQKSKMVAGIKRETPAKELQILQMAAILIVM
jgi:hypothetical protein